MCSSRKGTVDTALYLAESGGHHGGQYLFDAAQAARLETAASAVKHKQLPTALRAGVGFHYAAMEQEDRVKIEQLFLDRALTVSCSPHPFWIKSASNSRDIRFRYIR